MLMATIATYVSAIIQIFSLLIVAMCFISFIPQIDQRHPLVVALNKLTSPVLNPIRRMLPNMSGVDFSPVLGIFLLQTLGRLVIPLLTLIPIG